MLSNVTRALVLGQDPLIGHGPSETAPSNGTGSDVEDTLGYGFEVGSVEVFIERQSVAVVRCDDDTDGTLERNDRLVLLLDTVARRRCEGTELGCEVTYLGADALIEQNDRAL